MPNIQAIREKRHVTLGQIKALVAKAENDDRDFSDDEMRSYNELKKSVEMLDDQLQRAQFIADAERSMETDPNQPRRGNDGTFDQACRSFQVTRAIAAMVAPGEVDAGREIEVSREIARRSGRSPSGIFVPHTVFEERDVTAGGSGGNLVPTAHRAELMIDRLREALQVQQLGATILSGLVGDQDIPRLTGSATGYWVAEHGAVTESDHTFDSVSLQPKTVGAEVEYSRRMLINAVPSVEQLVRRDLASVLATEIDAKAISGDGTGNTPTGILSTSGIGDNASHGTDGGAPTWANVLAIINECAIDNALMGSLGWLTNPKVVKTMRGTVKVSSTDSVMIMETPDNLAGYPLRQTNQVPSDLTKGSGEDLSAIIFGNWADLLIGYWSAVDILVNPYHTDVYSKGGVKINALQDCDIAVRHPESFSIADDIVTS